MRAFKKVVRDGQERCVRPAVRAAITDKWVRHAFSNTSPGFRRCAFFAFRILHVTTLLRLREAASAERGTPGTSAVRRASESLTLQRVL